MRVALTSLYLPSGSKIGVGYQVHGLANALAERGHEVTVFSPCARPANADYDVEVVPPPRYLRTFAFAWDLRRVRFDRFDVLNAHGDDWFLWGVARPRHVHTFHGSCLAEMLNISGVAGRLRMGLLAACETQVRWLADETVAVSENTRRYIPGIRHVIPCGVNLARFSPGVEKSPRPSILFVGTMHGRKRGRLLLRVFLEHIRKQLPEAELWCVCEHPADLTDTPGVRWFGRLPEEELSELFRNAWAFCLPSSYEGFGVPYIEAMASGTVVVATRNPGAVEVTANGRYGFVVGDADLGEALLRVLKDAPLRRHLERAGLERSLDYSWASVAGQYEELFRVESGVALPV